ncbi:hypothetical protein [uncultured Aquimarina sp.]|uniref:hypothetical protein n=1 Tax=uncultured Aquimarina sp. TaxID=575652 RepID=UPI002605E15A|nr:hypothetical protein [uncultured Aquimarina sp.]
MMRKNYHSLFILSISLLLSILLGCQDRKTVLDYDKGIKLSEFTVLVDSDTEDFDIVDKDKDTVYIYKELYRTLDGTLLKPNKGITIDKIEEILEIGYYQNTIDDNPGYDLGIAIHQKYLEKDIENSYLIKSVENIDKQLLEQNWLRVKQESLENQKVFFSKLLQEKKKYEKCCPEYIEQASDFLKKTESDFKTHYDLNIEAYVRQRILKIEYKINNQVKQKTILYYSSKDLKSKYQTEDDALEIKKETKQRRSKDSIDKNVSNQLLELRKEMYAQYKNRKADFLPIYVSFSYQNKKNDLINLVPLTDSYRWSEHKDSSVVANRYLRDIKIKNDNYHELSPVYRERFLQRMNISEKHKIFVYNTSSDTIFVYNVNEQPVVGILSPYESQGPFRQEDYIIGFDLNNTPKKDSNSNEPVFVYIGEENPFQVGHLQPIIWNKIDYSFFGSYFNHTDVTNIDRSLIREVYNFSTDSLDYFMLDIGTKERNSLKRLIVFDKSSKTLLTDLFHNEGEGRSYTHMAINKGESKSFMTEQMTGKLFKDKPPVFFGLLYHSFGCSKIYFIEKERNFIRLRCDNRH